MFVTIRPEDFAAADALGAVLDRCGAPIASVRDHLGAEHAGLLALAFDVGVLPPAASLRATRDIGPVQRALADLETLGLVRGNTIRARNIGHDITAAFKSIVGGEISEYTKMMAESREQALDRMRAEAVAIGANAVVGVRFTTSMIMAGSSEILAYGTAVRVERAR